VKVPAELPEDSRVLGVHYVWFPTSDRLKTGPCLGSSVRFRQQPDNSNSHEFELHRPSNKGTKLLLKVIKAIIIIMTIT